MKIILSLLGTIIFVFGIHAQDIKKKGNVTVKTTLAGQYSPLSQLSHNATGYKFFIQDSILKNFQLEFQLERYIGSDSAKVNSLVGEVNVDTSIRFELIPDIKQDGSLLLLFYWQRGAISQILPSHKGYQYKWIVFEESGSPIKRETPLLLIYEEKLYDDTLEKAIHKFSKSTSFKNNDKESIIKNLYLITDSFSLISYTIYSPK